MRFQGPERRLRTRYRVRIPFLLKAVEETVPPVRGTTRNISLLGISAYTESSMNPAQPVQCLLEFPSKPQPLVAQGTIIRCAPLETPHPDGPYEVGVFFKAFQGNGEKELVKFLQEAAQQEQAAIQDGYRELKRRLAQRRRKKRLEALRKQRRRQARLRKRRLRLARQKRLAKKRKQAEAKRQAEAKKGKRTLRRGVSRQHKAVRPQVKKK